MATTTYCDQDDIEDVLSDYGVLAIVDDDEGGSNSAAELTRVTAAIERAAGRMNQYLETRYTLSDLASNDWCKYCNADLAAYYLTMRRGHAAPQGLEQVAADRINELQQIQLGNQRVPEVANSFETIPTVSNFQVRRGDCDGPIMVDGEHSTGSAPVGSRKRNIAPGN